MMSPAALGLDWPALAAADVHVWHLDLDSAALPDVLSAPEQARAAQMADPVARALYRLAHNGLRHVLGRYLHQTPASLRFGRLPQGKPVLEGPATPAPAFNLSHSGRRVVIGVSAGGDLGVDIEQMRATPRHLAVAKRFFAAEEYAFLAAQPVQDQPLTFYRLWTLKEAFIKLTGRGLAQPLDSFAIRPTPWPHLLRGDTGAEAWTYHCAPEQDGYACAVISARAQARIRHFTL